MRLAQRTAGVGLSFASGDGYRVRASDGQEYVDLVCGYGPVVLGHRYPGFLSAVTDLLAEGVHFPAFADLHREYLAEAFPRVADDWYAGLFKTSSEAVAAAFRVAGVRSGRRTVVRCGYLGWLDRAFDPTIRWHEQLDSPARRTRGAPSPLTSDRALSWDDGDLDRLDELLRQQDVGLFAFDAYQAHLLGEQPLLDAVALCRERGVLVFADETKTAGRIGPLGWLHEQGHVADLIVLGKAIANGHPLSLLVMPEFDQRLYAAARVGGTYGKELSGVAAALATHRLMTETAGFDVLRGVGDMVARVGNRAFAEAGISPDVCRWTSDLGGGIIDLAFGPDLVGDPARRKALVAAFRRVGVLIVDGQPSYVSIAHRNLRADEWRARASAAIEHWSRPSVRIAVDERSLAAVPPTGVR